MSTHKTKLLKERLDLTTVQGAARGTQQKKSKFSNSGQVKESTNNFNCFISCLAVCLKAVKINSEHTFHTSQETQPGTVQTHRMLPAKNESSNQGKDNWGIH